MNKRNWFYALLLALPMALAVPLWLAASWRPQSFGAHPFGSKSPPTTVTRSVPVARFNLMFSPDGARLLSISDAGAVGPARGLAMWDVGGKRVIWKKTQGDVLDWVPLCFSPDGQTLAMAHNPGPHCCLSFVGPGLALFDAETGKQITALKLNQFAYTFQDAAFSPDGKYLTTATEKGVQRWDVSAKNLVSERDVPSLVGDPNLGFRPNIAFSRSGERVVFNWGNWGGRSKTSQIHTAMRDLETGSKWRIPGVAPVYASFSPDGHWLLLSNRHAAQLEVRESANGRLVWHKSFVMAQPQRGAWIPDENSVVVDAGQEFHILDAQTGQTLRTLPHRALRNFVVSPDGAQLYLVDFDGKIWSQRLK